MLIERRAKAQERRVVPETIARFLTEAADFVPLTLKPVPRCRTRSTHRDARRLASLRVGHGLEAAPTGR